MQVEPEATPEEGYHLTPDLVDKAKAMIADAKQVAQNKPFFMYFCPGAQHAPHHVPREWADKYKGQFDKGWDHYREETFRRQKELGVIPQNTVMSRHDPDVQDWDSLSDDERKLYARMMEVFAGFLEHTDHYRGGVSDPFIISWPKGIKAKGEVRTQFCHGIDMVPTVLDCLGVEPPATIRGVTQAPIEGFSLKNTFDDSGATGLHQTQYYEMFGHRSLYHAGWRAVCPWPGTSFVESGGAFGDEITHDKLNALDASGWELYNLVDDPAETTDLADQEKARLIEMIGISSEGEPRPIAANGRGAQHPGHFLFPV